MSSANIINESGGQYFDSEVKLRNRELFKVIGLYMACIAIICIMSGGIFIGAHYGGTPGLLSVAGAEMAILIGVAAIAYFINKRAQLKEQNQMADHLLRKSETQQFYLESVAST